MKNILTFKEFLNESLNEASVDASLQSVKPMKGLKYKKIKAKELEVGDEISDGPGETREISKVVSINPIKLEVAETIVPKNTPQYVAPGTSTDVELKPTDEVYKIIR
jgi:hypothetical protein